MDFRVISGVSIAADPDEYMVRDDVWPATGLGPNDGWLCFSCLERRLGRKLELSDLIDVPANDWLRGALNKGK